MIVYDLATRDGLCDTPRRELRYRILKSEVVCVIIMASSTSLPQYCELCGSVAGGKSRCSACKEAWYCSKEHQQADWGASHKPICRHVKHHPEAIFVKIEAGEGNGLTNQMTNYVFENKDRGLAFVLRELHGHMSRPLRSQLAEILGWKLEVYCSTTLNQLHSSGMMEVLGQGSSTLNGAGIHLGCDIQSGISRFNDLCREIYVFGRRIKDGRLIVSDSLWGALNFIWDAMDLYGEEEDPGPSIMRRVRRYREGSWTPVGGDGGVDVFCVDVNQSIDRVESAVDAPIPTDTPQQNVMQDPSLQQARAPILSKMCRRFRTCSSL